MYKKLKLLIFAATLSMSVTGILPLSVFTTAVLSVEAASTSALNKKNCHIKCKTDTAVNLKK